MHVFEVHTPNCGFNTNFHVWLPQAALNDNEKKNHTHEKDFKQLTHLYIILNRDFIWSVQNHFDIIFTVIQ